METKDIPQSLTGPIDNDCFVSLVILKSRSKSWERCVELCRKSPVHAVCEKGAMASFNGNIAEVGNLLEILNISGKWRGTNFFSYGKQVERHQISIWINCFAKYLLTIGSNEDCACDTFCVIGKRRFISPCRHLDNMRMFPDQKDIEHGMSLLAHRWGIIYCPYYDFSKFKNLFYSIELIFEGVRDITPFFIGPYELICLYRKRIHELETTEQATKASGKSFFKRLLG